MYETKPRRWSQLQRGTRNLRVHVQLVRLTCMLFLFVAVAETVGFVGVVGKVANMVTGPALMIGLLQSLKPQDLSWSSNIIFFGAPLFLLRNAVISSHKWSAGYQEHHIASGKRHHKWYIHPLWYSSSLNWQYVGVQVDVHLIPINAVSFTAVIVHLLFINLRITNFGMI